MAFTSGYVEDISTVGKASFDNTGEKKRTALSFSFPWICASSRHKLFPFYISPSFSIFPFHLYNTACCASCAPPTPLPHLAHLPNHSNSPCTYLAYSRHRRDILSCLLSRGRSINYVIILVSCDTAGLSGFPRHCWGYLSAAV